MRPYLSVLLFAASAVIAPGISVGDDLPLLAKVDFETGDLAGWKLSDPPAFKIVPNGAGKALALATKAKYAPKVRSPFGYALWERDTVEDFTLEVDCKSTVKDYGHRDLCLFFGYQGPSKFYYVHVAKAADPHAHSVFLVNDAPRVSIAKERTKGFDWTDGWHKLRLERKGADVKVFIDGGAKPIMHAVDSTFAWGKVGVGSFDDTGMFDNFTLRGVKHAK